MDPFTLFLSGASLLGSVASSIWGSSNAADTAKIQKQNAGLEMQADEQRHKQMLLENRRMQLQNIRNAQRARSLALTSSTSQGAQFGTGLAGGYGQISGESGVNAQGFSNALDIGNNMFGINQQIDANKMKLADQQTNQSYATGLGSFSNSIGVNAKGIAGMGGLFDNWSGNVIPQNA